ncbi:hypothetical protein OAL67_00910 [bacterium]|nr:hypothetical protein [bacterium]
MVLHPHAQSGFSSYNNNKFQTQPIRELELRYNFVMNIQNESKLIKDQADKLLKSWSLLEYLNKYGDAYSVGSVALDLMTWRDIDLEVICDKEPSKNDAIDVARYLFNKDGFRKVSPIDYSDGDGIKKPKGLYIGTEYVDEDKNKWKVDVWLLATNFARTKEKTEEIRNRLTPEFRNIILDIKSQVHDHPLYRKKIVSVDIYDAVTNDGVKNLEDFKEYLKDKGIEVEI